MAPVFMSGDAEGSEAISVAGDCKNLPLFRNLFGDVVGGADGENALVAADQ
jgi:hypothetical protein